MFCYRLLEDGFYLALFYEIYPQQMVLWLTSVLILGLAGLLVDSESIQPVHQTGQYEEGLVFAVLQTRLFVDGFELLQEAVIKGKDCRVREQYGLLTILLQPETSNLHPSGGYL